MVASRTVIPWLSLTKYGVCCSGLVLGSCEIPKVGSFFGAKQSLLDQPAIQDGFKACKDLSHCQCWGLPGQGARAALENCAAVLSKLSVQFSCWLGLPLLPCWHTNSLSITLLEIKFFLSCLAETHTGHFYLAILKNMTFISCGSYF
jgi:hypothetical protein